MWEEVVVAVGGCGWLWVEVVAVGEDRWRWVAVSGGGRLWVEVGGCAVIGPVHKLPPNPVLAMPHEFQRNTPW